MSYCPKLLELHLNTENVEEFLSISTESLVEICDACPNVQTLKKSSEYYDDGDLTDQALALARHAAVWTAEFDGNDPTDALHRVGAPCPNLQKCHVTLWNTNNDTKRTSRSFHSPQAQA